MINSVFKVIPLRQPNLFQKLLKQNPTSNLQIELNNLLAENDLDKLSEKDVEFIINRYKNFPKREDLLKLYSDFFNNCIKDLEIEANERNQLQKLQNILGLRADEIEALELSLREEIVMLKLKEIMNDGRISESEWEDWKSVREKLNVSLNFDYFLKDAIQKCKQLWLLENKPLQPIDVPIALQKNELCYYRVNVDWLENRRLRMRANYHGPTARIKIMKGVYYRVGSLSIQPVYQEELQVIDSGMLYITNKRLIFDGSRQNKVITLKSLFSITPYSDGVGIEKNGKSPIFRTVKYAEETSIILSKLMNEEI